MTLEDEKKQDEIEQKSNDEKEECADLEIDNDEIDSSEELEEKKREINEFNVEGNNIQNQINIQDVGSGGLTVNYYNTKMVPITLKLPVEKRYDLRKLEDCIEFIETFKNSEYVTTAIILCIFEAVILTDLLDLKSKLIQHLPEEILYDTEGQEIHVAKESPYTALNTVLAVIGAKKFVTKEGQQCISIGEDSTPALVNMLEQFPALHDSVTKLLIEITQEDKYHMMFYDYQVALSLSRIFSFKVIDLENRILPSLYTNSDNVYLLGTFVYKLYKEREKEAQNIILQWLCADRTWLWKPASLAYVLLQENEVLFPFEKELKTILLKKITYYRKNDFDFITELLMQSKHFRTMICSVFSYAYKHAGTNFKRKDLAQSYLYLVRRSYYRVNSIFIELPLVACDTKQQQEYLIDILEKVMTEYRLRKQMYAILNAYLKELSQYDFSEKLLKHITAFCYNISLVGEEYREDMKEALQKCHSRASMQVIKLL